MDTILRYFPDLSPRQVDQFQQLGGLYSYWNERINLISRKDIEQVYTHHILHSLAIAKFISFRDGASVMDVGTGGGFPGIPLAIMFPWAEFYLIDSIEKKIKVVNDVIEKTGLTNCRAGVLRAEQVKEKFDFIVSRAVAPLPRFYGWVKKSISKMPQHTVPNGIIYLKGGDLTEELAPFEDWYTLHNISDYFSETYFDTKKIVHLFKY
ncbi:MAG: 16S rRNA (guanine(527)-N(7))-methyltransferase RsmG [Bacteroidales bacterium]|nr:16S rRNA (guanine(527)-N(7))-methyltransferase RsmG [Bacteroidales bacterium]